MSTNNENQIICSQSGKFALVYDGYNDDYFILYDDQEIHKFNDVIKPIELWNSVKLKNFNKLEEYDDFKDLNQIIKTLYTEITIKETKIGVQQRIFNDLLRNLSDYYKDDDDKYLKNLDTASQGLILFIKDLSDYYGCDTELFDDLLSVGDIEEKIQQRANPVLTREEKAKADAIAKQVKEKGLLNYLDDILKDIHKGEHKNIYRKILMLFKIMRGEASFLSETTAKSEGGKSFEDDIVFNLIAPERYIYKSNDFTDSAFIRYGAQNEYYFDRQIIVFGDLGAKKAFKEVEPIFNKFKPLITEKQIDKDMSDKNDPLKTIHLTLKVNSFGAVYQTTLNSFTKDDDQLISRTLYSTPANVDVKSIIKQNHYLFFSKSKQSKLKAKAEQKLKDFGLYLMQMVNKDIEIANPYTDIFLEYAMQSDTPIREHNQQLELFDAYCILTHEKAQYDSKGTLFASLDQLKEYMDFINLENALIPIEYDFLKMLKADGKANQLTILYNEYDLKDADGNNKPGIQLKDITTLTECENNAIELLNDDYAETKADLSTKQLKNIPYKLMNLYGLRSAGAKHKDKIFFRLSDLKIYSKYNAYKNVDNVGQMLQTLHNKGYLGKYEQKHDKENIYYLTPMCNDLNKKFEPKMTYDEYVTNFIANVGYENL